MKRSVKRMVSLLLAVFMVGQPAIQTAESVVSSPKQYAINQGAVVEVDLATGMTNPTAVGDYMTFVISSSVSTTQSSEKREFRIKLEGYDFQHFDNPYFSAPGDEFVVNGTKYTVVQDADGVYLKYVFSPGETKDFNLPIRAKNGISGKEQTLKLVPEIIGKQDNDIVGASVTGKWTGDFDWDVVKSADPSSLSLDANKKPNEKITYTFNATSNNRGKATGAVWTEELIFEDQLNLPEGVTLPEGCSVDQANGKIMLDDQVIYQLNLPQNATLDSFTINGNRIDYRFSVSNPNMQGSIPNQEMENISFTACLDTKMMMIDQELTVSKTIENRVTLTADPYHSDDVLTLSDDAVVHVPAPAAKLSVTKTADKSKVAAGDIIRYTITVQNTGTAMDTIEIKDTLPKGLYLTDEQKQAISGCVVGDELPYQGITITWENQEIQAGQSWTRTFDATVKDVEALQELGITSGHWFHNGVAIPGASTGVSVEYLAPQINMEKHAIDKRDTPYTVGDTIDFELKASNPSTVNAPNVVITDTLPRYLRAVADGGKPITESGPYTIGGRSATVTIDSNGVSTIKIAVGDIPAGADKTVTMKTIVCDLPSQEYEKNVKNTVISNYGGYDEETVELDVAKLIITKESSKDGIIFSASTDTDRLAFEPGEIVYYRVTVENDSGVPMKDIVITDVLPWQLDFFYKGEVKKKTQENQDPNQNKLDCSDLTAVTDDTVSVLLDWYPPATITWEITGEIPAGGTRELVFQAMIREDTANGAIVTNHATTGNTGGSNEIIVVKGQLNLTKVADKQTAKDGDIITYTIYAHNNTSVPVKGVEITDEKSDYLEFVYDKDKMTSTAKFYTLDENDDEIYNGVTRDIPFTVEGNKMTWRDDALELQPGEGIAIEVKAKVINTEGLTNGALIYNRVTGKPGGNEGGSEVVLDKPSLVLSKAVEDSEKKYVEGDPVTFNLLARNDKDIPVVGATLTDKLPEYLHLVVDGIEYDEANVAGLNGVPLTKTWDTANGREIKMTATFNINANGRVETSVEYEVGDLNKDEQVEIELEAVICHVENLSGGWIHNLLWANTGDTTHKDIEVEKPKLDLTKSHQPPVDKAYFEENDIVTFTITLSNSSERDVTARDLVLTDILPKYLRLVKLSEGGEYVGVIGEEYTGSFATAYTISGGGTSETHDASATYIVKWDGIYVELNIPELKQNETITWTIDTKIVDLEDFYQSNDNKLTNKVNVNNTIHVDDSVEVAEPLGYDKKVLVDGQEVDGHIPEITEGCTIEYIVKLINRKNEPETFISVLDFLPSLHDYSVVPAYSMNPGDKDNPDVAYVSFDVVADCSSFNVVPSMNQNGIWWGNILVPPQTTAAQKVTVRFPKGEAFKKYMVANQGATPKNQFTYGGKPPVVVDHILADAKPEVYVQKGVQHLGEITAGWDGKPSYSSDSSGTSKHQFGNRDHFVVYYISIFNTGEVPITLKTAEDILPEGLKYVGLTEGWWNSSSFKQECAIQNALVSPSIGVAWNSTVRASVDPADPSKILFNFSRDNGGIVLPKKSEGNNCVVFGVVCEIPASVDVASTNTFSLTLDGNVGMGHADVTSNSPHNTGAANDGGCKRTYTEDSDGGETTFTSSVTVRPGTSFLPGITKEAIAYLPNGNDTNVSMSGLKPILPESQIKTFDSLQWKITISNYGIANMPLNWLEDTIDYPYTISAVDDRSPTIQFIKANTPPGAGQKITATKISQESTISTTYHYDLSAYTLEPGQYAEIWVMTDNMRSVFNNDTYVNKAVLKPKTAFKEAFIGEPGDQDEGGNYTTLCAQDAVTIRDNYATTAWKKVEEAGNLSNVADSYAATEEGKNYIVLAKENENREAYYTLAVKNEGYLSLTALNFIDNLPYPGDVGALNATERRGSDFAVELLTKPEVVIVKGDSVTPLGNESFRVEYSTVQNGFSEGDYQGQSDGKWSAQLGEAKSIRVCLIRPVQPGECVEVRFKVRLPADAKDGEIAWNNFGYFSNIAGNEIKYTNYASPPRVGVAVGSYNPKTTLEIVKTDEHDEPIAGAEFVLRKQDGETVSPQKSEDGTRFSFLDLGIGSYTLEETKAPGGYPNAGWRWTVTVEEVIGKEGLEVTIVPTGSARQPVLNKDGQYQIQNLPLYPLPATGGIGTQWYVIGGLMLMLTAGLIVFLNRRRTEKGASDFSA